MVDISAHRGGSEDAQPATYAAYRQAPSTGAEYVEWDIRRTRDRVLVAYHDARAAHGHELLADLSYAGLCQQAGYEVARVDLIMDLIAGQLIGHLDLKETGYERELVLLAEERLGTGNYVITTLEDSSVTAIKSDFPDVRTALSLGRDLANVLRYRRIGVRLSERYPLPRIRACGADWVAVHHKLARLGVASLCHRNDLGVMVWTVDADDQIAAALADPAIDVLITNRPRYAVARRAELAGREGGGRG